MASPFTQERMIAPTNYARRGRAFRDALDKKRLLDLKSARPTYPMVEIADRLHIPYKRALKLWKEIEQEVQRDMSQSREAFAAMELQRLDRIIEALGDAWVKSCEPKTVDTKGISDGKAHASIQTIKQHGDAALMAQMLKAIDLRCKLAGAFAPEKHEHVHEFGRQAVQAFTKICMVARTFIDPARWDEWKAEALKVRGAFADPPARIRSSARQESN